MISSQAGDLGGASTNRLISEAENGLCMSR